MCEVRYSERWDLFLPLIKLSKYWQPGLDPQGGDWRIPLSSSGRTQDKRLTNADVRVLR